MKEAKNVLKAWYKLPGGHNSIRETQDWLVDDMAPAMKKLRKKLKEMGMKNNG